jgi:hypothetical protein
MQKEWIKCRLIGGLAGAGLIFPLRQIFIYQSIPHARFSDDVTGL